MTHANITLFELVELTALDMPNEEFIAKAEPLIAKVKRQTDAAIILANMKSMEESFCRYKEEKRAETDG